ncbi:hypothetical protein VCV18_003824 [Metarhizium anisopliae]
MRCRGRCFRRGRHNASTSTPLCGECAVLFYDKAPHAFWLAELDINAIMSSQIQYMAELEEEMEELLQEIDQARQESEDGW